MATSIPTARTQTMIDHLPDDLYQELGRWLSEADVTRARKACSALRGAMHEDPEEITTSSDPSDQQAWRQELLHIVKLAPALAQLTIAEKLTHAGSQKLHMLSSMRNLKSLRIPNGALLRDQSVAAIAALTQLQHLQINRAAQLSSRALEHLRALTNLSSLDLKECHNISWGAFAQAQAQAQQQEAASSEGDSSELAELILLPSLTSLSATCSHAFAAQPALEAAAIAALANLRELELQRCNQLTDAALVQLATLTQLTHLKLSSLWSVSDKGLAPLAGLCQVASLALAEPNRATGSGLLAALAPLTALTQLALALPGGRVLASDAAKLLAGLQQLASLELALPSCSDELFEQITELPCLQDLHITGACQLSSAAMPALAAAAALRTLRLQDCYGVAAGAVLSALAGTSSVTSLTLANIAFVPADAPTPEAPAGAADDDLALGTVLEQVYQQQQQQQQQQPQQLPQDPLPVQHLELSACAYLCDTHLAQVVRACPALASLHVEACPEVSDAGVAEAAALHCLTSLHLAGCQVDGSFASGLASLPGLSDVSVSGSELLDDAGCALLASLPLLRKAGVAGCMEVGHPGLAALLALPHLRQVDATGCSPTLWQQAAVPTHMRLLH